MVCLLLPLSGCLVDEPTAPPLEAPPAWQVGDWWTYHVRHVGTAYEAEVTVVVADVRDGMALVGMAPGPDFHWALITHVPMLGAVDTGTLAWQVHDRVFEPVRFPLAEGAAWTTQWMRGGELSARVVSVSGDAAEIRVEGDWSMAARYDGAVGALSDLVIDGYAQVHLRDHGHGYRGEVVVPEDLSLAWYPVRFAGVFDRDLAPAPPVHEEMLAGDADEVTFALIAGTTDLPGPLSETGTAVPVVPAGAFRVQVDAPDGASWVLDASGVGVGRPLVVEHHPAVPGTWTMTLLAAGQGEAAVEAFAYKRGVYLF